MKRIVTTFSLLMVSMGVYAQQPPDKATGLDCILQPHEVVHVGSPSPGVIDRILVKRGDLVIQDQPVVEMVSTVEKAALAVARERAAQVGDTAIASSSQELASRELSRASQLYDQRYVSEPYLDKRRAEARVARGRSAKAREKRRLAVRELELAMAQVRQRTIRSPISGVVVERFLSPGEYFDQKPVLRIASINPLRVDVLVPAVAFGQIKPGMTGQVTPELLSSKSHQATVSTVDRVIDAASNTFRVRLELPNPNGALPSGLRCRVDLGIDIAAIDSRQTLARQ